MHIGAYAATVLLFGVVGYSALAQVPAAAPSGNGARPGHAIGVGASLPRSSQASNIEPGDTRSAIAPTLPPADVGEDDGADSYLMAARAALVEGRTGEAQQELEMAETRVLDRSVAVSQANTPSSSKLVALISAAREALGKGDSEGAIRMIDRALAG